MGGQFLFGRLNKIKSKEIKGDRLLFLTSLKGLDLAIEKKNFTAFYSIASLIIRPDPRAVLFLIEKVACPLFFLLN